MVPMGRSSHSKYKHIYIWLAWINPQDWCWRDLFHISLPPGSQSSQTIISSIESDFSARCETSVEFYSSLAWPCSISRPGGGSCLMWGKQSLVVMISHVVVKSVFNFFLWLADLTSPHHINISLLSLSNTTLTGTFKANLQWGRDRGNTENIK